MHECISDAVTGGPQLIKIRNTVKDSTVIKPAVRPVKYIQGQLYTVIQQSGEGTGINSIN